MQPVGRSAAVTLLPQHPTPEALALQSFSLLHGSCRSAGERLQLALPLSSHVWLLRLAVRQNCCTLRMPVPQAFSLRCGSNFVSQCLQPLLNIFSPHLLHQLDYEQHSLGTAAVVARPQVHSGTPSCAADTGG